MSQAEFTISDSKVICYFDTSFTQISRIVPPENLIVVTDENIDGFYGHLFLPFRKIVIAPGENNKNRAGADFIIDRLIEMEADRSTLVLGVGGGVVTDLTGYAASVYKRGIRLAFAPTSVLAMVDAAIGGKNGLNTGFLKNIIGTTYQPEFILFDYNFLTTLPAVEWESGFAEIIKHACIRDMQMFETLERLSLHDYRQDASLLASLVEENVKLKMQIVLEDAYDRDLRLLLNFGHTIGHAVENLHAIPHGHAISIGMVAACNLSEKSGYLHFEEAQRVVRLLERYHLPVDLETEPARVFEILKSDKKRDGGFMNFIMLQGIGNGMIVPVEISFLEENISAVL
jgi:3-dehydroquinate synthase